MRETALPLPPVRTRFWKGATYQKLGNSVQARSFCVWRHALSPDSADFVRIAQGLKDFGCGELSQKQNIEYLEDRVLDVFVSRVI